MISATASVTISGKEFAYQKPWNGKRLTLSPQCPYLAFDTETDIVDLSVEIPRLALASASTGHEHVVLPPEQVSEFIRVHHASEFVFHNAAFDYWVVDRHLREKRDKGTRYLWRSICHFGRMHDSMLLDVVIRMAQGERAGNDWIRMRDLATVAADYTSLRVTKDDPYRERYAEIIGADWADVEDGFFEYAIKDPIVTLRAYQSMMVKAETIMRDRGYDPTLTADQRHAIRPDAIKRFGLLTEQVQVKGAIVLAQVTRNGVHLDAERVTKVGSHYRRRRDEGVATLQRAFPGILKVDGAGMLQLTKTKAPSVSKNYLRQSLVAAAAEVSAQSQEAINLPYEPNGKKVSTAAKAWHPYADKHPLIQLWVDNEKVSKLCQFFEPLQDGVVHPRYNTLVRTGRTSCESPNIQQIPREGGFRELFVPPPGHVLLAIDYSFIELVALAAICEANFGYSKLGDTIRAGIDPHCYTAAMLLDMPLEDFLALKEADDEVEINGVSERKTGYRFKKHRQAAKPVNFGVPAGMGAPALVEYARANFSVVLSFEEVTEKRRKLITEIYPELNDQDGYLADDGMVRLARKLQSRTEDCWKALDWRGTRDSKIVGCVQKIVRRTAIKADGTPYKASYVAEVWEKLNALNRTGDPRLTELLKNREGGEELFWLLFSKAALTLTGRVRGGVEYTQSKNTPFQSLAADGAKLALWELFKEGFHVIGFVHDEILVAVRDEGGYVSLEKCEEIKRAVSAPMASLMGTIPVTAEYSVSRCWSKEAEFIVKGDKVYAWEPPKPEGTKHKAKTRRAKN
jgi:DNA polymerase I-like protein with 3'-5' exonuclease and polymerase domains